MLSNKNILSAILDRRQQETPDINQSPDINQNKKLCNILLTGPRVLQFRTNNTQNLVVD